jgi:hypothetical protein
MSLAMRSIMLNDKTKYATDATKIDDFEDDDVEDDDIEGNDSDIDAPEITYSNVAIANVNAANANAWQPETIEGTLYAQAMFLKTCGVFVKVSIKNKAKDQIWLIFCPVCLSATDENGKFLQGMAGLREHLLCWHPEACKGVKRMDIGAVGYIRDHCRLYDGEIRLERLRTLMRDPDAIASLTLKPNQAVQRTTLPYRIDKVKKLIDGDMSNHTPGASNRDTNLVTYVDCNKTRTSTPEKAKRWSRLEQFPTVVKTSDSDTAPWSALSCQLCGGNCGTSHGAPQYLCGIDGFRAHVRAAHKVDEGHALLSGPASRGRFVTEYCDEKEVDPRTVSDVPKTRCLTVEQYKDDREMNWMVRTPRKDRNRGN